MEFVKKLIEIIMSIFFKKKESPAVVSEPIVEITENSVDIIDLDVEFPVVKEMPLPPHDYSKVVVCLDAGHGEATPGKRSPYSLNGVLPALPLREYAWNREIVARIETELKMLGFNVYIVTPEEKEDVALSTRYKRANALKESACGNKFVFVSVHANACGNGKDWNTAKGWCCYTTKGQNNSDKFADCLYDVAEEVFKPMGMSIRTDKSDGDRDWEENFTVIYGANMPAILTENFFYTNIDDTRFILSEEGKEAITKVHVDGICKFVESMYGC